MFKYDEPHKALLIFGGGYMDVGGQIITNKERSAVQPLRSPAVILQHSEKSDGLPDRMKYNSRLQEYSVLSSSLPAHESKQERRKLVPEHARRQHDAAVIAADVASKAIGEVSKLLDQIDGINNQISAETRDSPVLKIADFEKAVNALNAAESELQKKRPYLEKLINTARGELEKQQKALNAKQSELDGLLSARETGKGCKSRQRDAILKQKGTLESELSGLRQNLDKAQKGFEAAEAPLKALETTVSSRHQQVDAIMDGVTSQEQRVKILNDQLLGAQIMLLDADENADKAMVGLRNAVTTYKTACEQGAAH